MLSFVENILTGLLGKTDNLGQINKSRSSTFHISNNVCLQSNVLGRKKISGRNKKDVITLIFLFF